MSDLLISQEPATGAVIWSGSVGDTEQEVRVACEAWPGWAARPLTVRVELLRRFANIVRSRTDILVETLARETGTPLWEARDEVETVIARVNLAAAAYSERTGQRKLDGALSTRNAVRHKPYGVLGIITPFCQPLQIAADQIIPALIAGNAVVVKPSEKAIGTVAALVDCFRAAEIPEGVVRLLAGGPAEGAALAAHPGIDGLIFTGSTRTGMALHRQFSETPQKILAIAMGGNNPILVWETAAISAAAAIVVQSAFLSAGQRCMSARRLIVRDGIHEPLLEEIGKLLDRMIIGNPFDKPAPFMGPLIDNHAADVVNDAFLDLMLKGARPIRHMQRIDASLPYLRPGIIDVTNLSQRADIEIFGPLLQMIRVPDFEAAVAEANTTRFGLCTSLIGGGPELYDRFWASIRTSVINWNRPTTIASPSAPVGGVGLSGNHRPGSTYRADTVAYPVSSSEAEQLRASIGIGLADS